MTNDCKTCPVSTGTHKPAEAVHQIDEPQADALLELAAYRFTVENREARIAELEAELEAVGAGGVQRLAAAPQAVQWLAALDALQEAEAALELAIHRILKRDPGHAVHVTSEAKALVAVRAALDTAAPAHPAEGVHAAVIAGAIFDFAGYLTTLPHEKALHCSEAHEASPMVEAITEWCKRRGLRTDGARVETWRAALAAKAKQGAE